MKIVDLHVHTSVSDGLLSPFEVVSEAREAELAAVAITDHDTMDGIAYAEEAGRNLGIEVVPGVELSATYGGNEFHILGYYCDPNNPFLKKTLKEVRRNRYDRMMKMLEKLKKLGIHIELKEVLQVVKGQMLGRPHLAVTMFLKGYCKTPAEAFENYIGFNGPAYVERMKFSPYDAIFIIRNARGIPVLAHPSFYKEDKLIPSLVNAGLLGIEVFHPDHQLVANYRYMKIARKYNLLITGGSDFHGSQLGSAETIGAVTVDYNYLEKLKNVSKAIRKGLKRF